VPDGTNPDLLCFKSGHQLRLWPTGVVERAGSSPSNSADSETTCYGTIRLVIETRDVSSLQRIEHMGSSQFLPFYERLSGRFLDNIFGRAFISGLLGLAFLVVQNASIGNKIFDDWSWFLGVLISAMTLFLYIATYTLHVLLSRMGIYSPHDGLKDTLSDRNFILAGSLFGTLNCVLGYSFGLPYPNGPAIISILFGYFLVGFVGGMAVLGIYGVFVAISAFSRAPKPALDFASPDNCGGTRFIGDALVIFSSVTLIAGVMISIYILKTNWSGDPTRGIVALKYFWIVFPYVMSLIILITPAIPLHIELRRYKLEEEDRFKSRLAAIRQSLEDDQLGVSGRKELRDDHEFRQNARRELHKMQSWPYGVGASSRYIIVLIANLIGTFNTYFGWVKLLMILTGR
jgi:hypothetical protein